MIKRKRDEELRSEKAKDHLIQYSESLISRAPARAAGCVTATVNGSLGFVDPIYHVLEPANQDLEGCTNVIKTLDCIGLLTMVR